MKLLQPALLLVLILNITANVADAQTAAASNSSGNASVYSDIVGEFVPSNQRTDTSNELVLDSPQPIVETNSPVDASAPSNTEIFSPDRSNNQTDWRRTEAGQLWNTSDERGVGTGNDGDLRLQVGLDYLFFTRGAAADNLFASNDLGETFSLSDIDPGSDSTLRYHFLIADDGGSGFELTGYEFEDFNGSLTLEGEGITPEFFGGIPANPAESYEATYQSELKNFEANIWRRRSERFKFGFGLRYISLDEAFDIEAIEDPNATGNNMNPVDTGFFSNTENKILGGQLMARVYRPVVKKFYLEGGINAGFGFNRITAESNTANVDSSTEEDTTTGFFGFNGGVTYLVMDGVTLRAGYEGLLMTSIALAPDQSASISAFSDSRQIQTGDIYFSGAYFGTSFSF